MGLPVTALRLVFAAAYVLFCAFGAGLLMYPAQRSEADRYVSLLFGVLLALIGVAGLVLVLFIPVFDRCRPGPVPATAPSGNPAMFFRRSPFMVVSSVVFCLAFAVWAGTLAVVLHGHVVWASVPAVLAGVLLWPVAVVLTGKIKPGGLWLTPVGLEYRNEAVSWTLAHGDDRAPPVRPEPPRAARHRMDPPAHVDVSLVRGSWRCCPGRGGWARFAPWAQRRRPARENPGPGSRAR